MTVPLKLSRGRSFKTYQKEVTRSNVHYKAAFDRKHMLKSLNFYKRNYESLPNKSEYPSPDKLELELVANGTVRVPAIVGSPMNKFNERKPVLEHYLLQRKERSSLIRKTLSIVGKSVLFLVTSRCSRREQRSLLLALAKLLECNRYFKDNRLHLFRRMIQVLSLSVKTHLDLHGTFGRLCDGILRYVYCTLLKLNSLFRDHGLFVKAPYILQSTSLSFLDNSTRTNKKKFDGSIIINNVLRPLFGFTLQSKKVFKPIALKSSRFESPKAFSNSTSGSIALTLKLLTAFTPVSTGMYKHSL